MTERNLLWPEKRALGNGPKLYRTGWWGEDTWGSGGCPRLKEHLKGFQPRQGRKCREGRLDMKGVEAGSERRVCCTGRIESRIFSACTENDQIAVGLD